MELTPKVAIADSFLKAFAKIPKAKQAKVRNFMDKFQENPKASSLNYEKIHDCVDDKVRTVRVDQKYRAVVIAPPKGDVYLCVWVDNHDEAMDWAKNKRFEVNQSTGSMQVFSVQNKDQLAESPELYDDPIGDDMLFSGYNDKDLARIGVPLPLIPAVRAVEDEKDLDDLTGYLPELVSDVLYRLAAGYKLSEIEQELNSHATAKVEEIDVLDFAKALEKPDSRAHFKILTDDQELAEILAQPLDLWRVFLHPSQRRLAERDSASGPVQVLGGAGTGKTVVLIHRARYLARHVFNKPGDRILVTTFTRNLAGDLQSYLKQICSESEFERLEVVNLHRWANSFLKSQKLGQKIISASQQNKFWDEAHTTVGDYDFSVSFVRDEWEKIVQARDLTEEREYLRARRVGRGRRLGRKQRQQVWSIMSAYRDLLEKHGFVEQADVIREARLYVKANPNLLNYSAVLADEIQDFRHAELLLLRQLVPPGDNDMFLVGDPHQRIYGHTVSLGRCGIKVVGRSHRLKINYRTTEKIRNWAVAIIKDIEFDDMDEGVDDLRGYRSLRIGVAPKVEVCSSAAREEDFIVSTIENWLKQDNVRPADICVSTRTRELLNDRYIHILEKANIAAQRIKRSSDDELGEGVRVATMHRMKGLEFARILLVGVNDNTMPLKVKGMGDWDSTTQEEHLKSERSLLYVAATRARDELVVCCFGKPSDFIQ